MDSGLLSEDGSAMGRWDQPDHVAVEKLRWKVKMLAKTGRYGAAEFWMDKIACLSDYRDLNDFFDMCEYLLLDGQHAACQNLIESRGLHKTKPEFAYLLGRSHFANGELDDALKALTGYVPSSQTTQTHLSDYTALEEDDQMSIDGDVMMRNPGESFSVSTGHDDIYLSAIQVLRGKIYDRLDNQQMACAAYLQALDLDPFSSDALDYLTSRHAIQTNERKRLMDEVVPRMKLGDDPGEHSLPEAIYLSKLQPDYNLRGEDKVAWRKWEHSAFALNPDFLLTKAEFLLGRRDYSAALQCTNHIMKLKPFYRNALPAHISALVHLDRRSQLFDLSHRLTLLYPGEVETWYATAAYYFICGGTDMTRRYLAKAIAMDKSCGYVWLLYGHSFSREREHEQALAAYFHAVDVMKGSSFPYLYIAREYVRTNNFGLAEKFYGEARDLARDDPIVLYEVGVMQIKKSESKAVTVNDAKKELLKAVDNLKLSLKIVKADSNEQKMMDSALESILESLAAAYMKLKEGKEALYYATLAFQITAKNSVILKLMGMAHVLLGHISDAVDAFQRSLAVNKDDTMTKKMLNEATEFFAKEGLAAEMGALDLGVARKIRSAKGPMTDSSRLSIKRASSIKRKNSLVTTTAQKGTPEVADSSAMDMSVSMEASTSAEPSFMGDFQPMIVAREVTLLDSGAVDESLVHVFNSLS
ncbi:Cell division cycle protein 16-like protein [Hypsibius exemplaris]|uniref:Cell division cycle protein 16-like protein n=1 Tax=Hypsibius exemplaris TaxID=2072580 RepID=A0A1W0W9J7_HYPEX|nr:Cell division cycle protein 16-like protein [Hypsibius exemplaris]